MLYSRELVQARGNMNRHFTWIHVVFRRKYNMKLYFIDVHVVRLAEKQSASLIDTNLFAADPAYISSSSSLW